MTRSTASLVVLLALASSCAAPPKARPSRQTPSAPVLRLPDIAQPTGYFAHLELDPSLERFNGELRIEVQVRQRAELLWLNATGLEGVRASVEDGSGRRSLAVVPGGEDFVGLVATPPFSVGPATIRLTYRGQLDREHSRGVYTVREGDAWYAYTFFEPIDGRRAFPCFDEPNFKVPWQLELAVPPGNRAFANTAPEREVKDARGWAVTTFARSPPMPSYLVAFGVGPFDVVEAAPAGQKQIPVRIIVPKGRGPEASYAKETTPKIVAGLESFLGLPYPYDRLDMLVVPRDWGTMEHPGLVAIGQPLALFHSSDDTPRRRQQFTNIVTHELGHYWFGDFATMAWWDDTWLNEGLATWLDARVTEQLEPSWHFLLRATAQSRSMALDSDLALARPIHSAVTTRDQVLGSFDNNLTYAKGGSVLTMLERWLGDTQLRATLRGYLEAHAWGSVRFADLLEAFARGGAPGAAVLKSFVVQPGFPLISAQLTCVEGKARVHLSQERYVASGSPGPERWTVPVCMRSELGKHCAVLDSESAEIDPGWPSCPRWFLPNAEGVGYYRSRYSAEEGERLLAQAKLTEEERLAVVDDLAALAKRGDIPPAKALALAPVVAKDGAVEVVQSSLRLLFTAKPELLSNEGYARFSALTRKLYGEKFQQLGWDVRPAEAPETTRLRSTLLRLLAREGEDHAVRAEGRRRLERWLTQRASIHPDLVSAVLAAGAREGDLGLFDALLAQLEKTEDRHQREELIGALAGFGEVKLTLRALGLLVSGKVEPRDGQELLYRPLFRRESREAAWTFLEANFDAIAVKMRDDELNGLAEAIVIELCDAPTLARAERLFRGGAAKYGIVTRQFDSAVERARECIKGASVTMPAVEAYLQRTAPLR